MPAWKMTILMLAAAAAASCEAMTPTRGERADVPPPRILEEFEPELGFRQSIELDVDSVLYEKQSDFQRIEVCRSKHFGNILILDDVVQITQLDGDSYNEMMAHMPLFQHPNPKRVLVIGGGDGYVLSEVLKHNSVEHVDHVDLDGDVVETCKKFFSWGKAWDDPRANLHIADGAAFVKNAPDNYYDVIIQDSSDPWSVSKEGIITPLPSGVLYKGSHFRHLHRILSPNGVLCLQAESYNVPSSLSGVTTWRTSLLSTGFDRVRYGTISIPSYPTGQIGFLLSEKGDLETNLEVSSRFDSMVQRCTPTTYYHPPMQESAFHLPLWVHQRIYSDPSTSCKNTTSATK